jgi:hypothetical protein
VTDDEVDEAVGILERAIAAAREGK